MKVTVLTRCRSLHNCRCAVQDRVAVFLRYTKFRYFAKRYLYYWRRQAETRGGNSISDVMCEQGTTGTWRFDEDRQRPLVTTGWRRRREGRGGRCPFWPANKVQLTPIWQQLQRLTMHKIAFKKSELLITEAHRESLQSMLLVMSPTYVFICRCLSFSL